jgi:hypothetical protein
LRCVHDVLLECPLALRMKNLLGSGSCVPLDGSFECSRTCQSIPLEALNVQVDLEAEIRDAVQVVKPLVTNNKWLHVDMPAAVPPVFADGARLYQMLMQLLQNAIKHTTAGSITVHVSLQSTLISAVLVQVADTGLGMSDRAVQVPCLHTSPYHHWLPVVCFGDIRG